MSDTRYLDWPFFEPRHAELQRALDAWAAEHVAHGAHHDVDAECRTLVAALGRGGWLRHAVAGAAHGGAGETLDTRALCLIRETLARHSGLADFAFAMQGLGSGPLSLAELLSRSDGSPLPVLPLLLERAGQRELLPDLALPLQAGDHLLLCGSAQARARLRGLALLGRSSFQEART